QLLIGNSNNSHSADLQVRVTLAAGDLVDGAEAEVTVVRGIASRMELQLGKFLDPIEGRVKLIHDRFEGSLEGIRDTMDRLNQRYEAEREALVRQFAALESSIADLQSTSNFLASQLAGLAGFQPR